ncbi:MAG: amino acid adenylation domain-containing protein [Acidobacteria bacterium]|nr:MAG: amino acid adenylation domain-containing protein [Acidobacteriota bacterium]REK08746.1 MAG: amino acid adenylation domain-containing protein [Acidobacteriota bacterium]
MGYLIHHSLEAAVERDPAHPAFRCADQELDYSALLRRSRQLAHLLRDAGLSAGGRVGIYMPKCLELPVAVYGTLIAGGAYVPIDPGAPPERVRLLIEDCGIGHLLTAPARIARATALADELAAAGAPLRLVVGSDPRQQAAAATSGRGGATRWVPWTVLEQLPDGDPGVRRVEEDLAYVMVTSGSTGVPKGLMHTHRSGLAYAELSAREYGVGPQDRLGNHSPLHFDMSTFEYLTGPLCGATTVIIPEEVTIFPRSLAELIERERLSFWYSVPLALIQLLLHGGVEERDCSSLRWVLFGGEPFPPKHLARLTALWPHARFSNSYGPAEVNQCTAYHLPPGVWDESRPVPLGRVWDGAEGLIVGADDEVVAPGEVGELLIRSGTRMRGYWRRPELNRRAFYRRPTYPDFEDVFYRTGDLVREDEHGELHFLGRKDRQIKVRGYRVELDEVEQVLCSVEGVREAAAVALPDPEDEAGLRIAGVVLASAASADEATPLTVEALARAARAKLPAYAVPSLLEVRRELPRTGSGKIDRRALAEQLAAAVAQATDEARKPAR